MASNGTILLGQRVVHALKANTKNELPQRILFFDTETVEKIVTADLHDLLLRLGVACLVTNKQKRHWREKEWLRFTRPGQFFDFLESHFPPRCRLYLVAHNLSFDAQVVGLFPGLKERNFVLTKLIVNETTNIWTFRRGTSTLVCMDNMNYFHTSLKELGKSIGILKDEMPEVDGTDETWFDYCTQDVKVMVESWRLWFDFLREHDLGNFGRTIAGQAFNSFRHRFMPCQIMVHNNERSIALERAAYHGGRCECGYIGRFTEGPFYQLDINSMYSSVMSRYKYPVKLKSCVRSLPASSLERILDNYCVISHATLSTDSPVYPVKYNGRLCFPTGQFETVLTTEELRYALHHNHLVHIGRTAIYACEAFFGEYVDYFYTCRRAFEQAGNMAFAFLCKLMLNALYGKFGQRNYTWEEIEAPCEYPDGVWKEWSVPEHKMITYRSINGMVEREVGNIEGYNSLVAVAGEVTANARLYLWEIMEKAGRENVYYCDTDSVIVDDRGYRGLGGLMDSHRLGYLKLEEQSDTLEILNLKSYTLGSKTKLKGVKANAVRLDPHTFIQWQFQGLAGAIRAGDLGHMHLRKVTKHMRTQYNKGIVSESGRVIPFSFPMP
ncbi:DNA polymerase [Candidatus Bathyarchaeota archaeon]|nr:DNA polymerase [Candidatus Bathyarchaeota archaeon]